MYLTFESDLSDRIT